MNVVLDLDQTLISAEVTEEYDFKHNKNKAKLFKFHNMENYYIVFERPHLQEFLTYLFKNFNVSIWTAASKNYALFIINKIIIGKHKDRKLDWIFFSKHCELSKKIKGGTKDLSLLWDVFSIPGYNYKNTIIIDDLNEIFNIQQDNCILAPPFEFTSDESHKDSFLKEAIDKIEKIKHEKEHMLID